MPKGALPVTVDEVVVVYVPGSWGDTRRYYQTDALNNIHRKRIFIYAYTLLFYFIILVIESFLLANIEDFLHVSLIL